MKIERLDHLVLIVKDHETTAKFYSEVLGWPTEQVVQHLNNCGVAIEEGPVPRTGAMGKIESVYSG